MLRKTLSIAVTLAAALGGTCAVAATPASRFEIRLGQFDLNTPAGQSQLNRTVRRAALQACTVDDQTDTPQAKHLERLCYEDAVGQAQAQIRARTADRSARGEGLAVLDSAN
jgi:UrcA family protein